MKKLTTIEGNNNSLYKLNYSIVSLILFIILWIMTIVLVRQPGFIDIRVKSFLPLATSLSLIGIAFPILHLILRKKTGYPYKGRALAIVMVILFLILSPLLLVVFTGRLEIFTAGVCLGGYENIYKFASYGTCEKSEGYECSHITLFGFGTCDLCEKSYCKDTGK